MSPAEIIFERKISKKRFVSQGKIRAKEWLEPLKRMFQVGKDVLVKVEQRSNKEDRFESPYQIVGKVHCRKCRM